MTSIVYELNTCILIGWLTGYRAEVADMVRQAVLLQPELAFNFAKQWLETTICKPIDTGTGIFYCDQNTQCTCRTDSYKF